MDLAPALGLPPSYRLRTLLEAYHNCPALEGLLG